MSEKVIVSWSGGKDAALALHELKKQPEIEILSLLTSGSKHDARVVMHGVPLALIRRQADSLGYELQVMEMDPESRNEEYEKAMAAMLDTARNNCVSTVVFGDLFLEDVRRYRERMMAASGISAAFPLWGEDSRKVACSFMRLGFRALIVCVDRQKLGIEYLGCEFDEAFLDSLPPDVDPCGENGEFHSFVYDGPDFREPVPFGRGGVFAHFHRYPMLELLSND